MDNKLAPLEQKSLAKISSIAILTDSDGKVVRNVRVSSIIASLSLLTGRQGGSRNAGSPTCMVSIETVTENYELCLNYELYLYVLALFPRSPSENRPDPQQSQYMGFCSDGDAFRSFNPGLLLSRVPEAEKLPDILKVETSAVEVTE